MDGDAPLQQAAQKAHLDMVREAVGGTSLECYHPEQKSIDSVFIRLPSSVLKRRTGCVFYLSTVHIRICLTSLMRENPILCSIGKRKS